MATGVLSLQSETHSPNAPSSRRKPGSSLCTEGRSVRYDEAPATVRAEPVEAPSPFDAPQEVPLGDKLRANGVRSVIAAQSFAFCLALCLALLSPFPASAALNERTLDTGAIRLIFGKTQAGFIDEAYLDRNGDGTYTPDELIVKQAPEQPAVVVTYIAEPGATDSGVLTGRSITGRPTVDRVDVSDLKATIKGHLVFDTLGSTPFEVTLQGKRNSAVLTVDLAFTPLRNVSGLWLKEAALRVQGVFDTRDPGVSRRSMSTGDFRNTPRPDSPYQPLVWQLGGHLVESPWHWRNWLAWSESNGPATVQEGAVPQKTLEFFMRDDRQGIQAMALEPAGAAPFELAGNGLPSTLSLNAWSPRVPALPMRPELPARFEIRGMGLQFFRSGLEDLFNKGDAYWKKASAVMAASRDELARELSPLRSNLRTPGLNATQVQQRLAELAASPVRGWDANIRDTPLDSGGKPRAAERPDSGPGWLDITLDSAPTGDHPASATPWPLPVKGGIPFPRAALRSVDQLRLVNARGDEIPIQTDRLAMWPDGSVKWVLITLLANGGADAATPLRLEYGDRVTRKAAIPGRLEITPVADGLSVDTGTLHFQLTKRMSGVFDGLSLRNGEQAPQPIIPAANTERLNRMDLLALASPAGYAPYAFHAEGAQVELSRAEIESVEIERQGPLMANLLVKGRYHYKTLGRGRGNKDAPYRNEGCEFWIRYTVYAGQPYVEVKHSFVFEGNPDLEMIQDLSLHIPVDITGQTTFTVGADGKPVVIQNAQRAGIFQDNPDAAEIWSAPEETQKHSSFRRKPESRKFNELDPGVRRGDEPTREGAGETTFAIAAKADGWSDVSDATKGVTFGVRNMREMYAKELAFEDGHLNIGLWPKRARLLDTRRYSRQYVDGESTSYGQGAAQGVSRSHDLFLYFHTGDAASAGSAAMAARLLKPAILKAQPAWYANSEAAGAFRPRDARTYAPWERMISDGIDYFFYHRELWSWFGIYDYGDLQQVPNGRGGWQRLSGRWGWVNNEALIDMLFYEQFMRTGQSEYLDAALAMTHHTQEVDLINSHDYKGNRLVKMHGHRHNVDHWGDGYVGIRGAAPQGFRLGYYLTGDLRIYDQLRMGMDAHWSSMNSYDKEHSSGLGYLSFFWEATGDPLYRDALKAYLDFQTAHFAKFGHIHGGVWDFKKDINRPLPAEPVSESPTGFFFQDFGSAYSLMELADLTGRADLTKALVQFARDTIQQRGNTWEAQYCHYRLMAFAYRHTGDPVFLRYATDHAAKLAVSPNRQAWATSSAIDAFDNKLSMLAWSSQGLPYLMQAMDERAKDPVVAFNIPAVLPVPRGKTSAGLPVDASETRARDGTLAALEWQVDEQTTSRKPSDTLTLAPGKHQITLLAADSAKRSASASKTITVWDPGVVARLCFRGQIDGFAGGEYSDDKGYGFTKGTRLIDSSEPQRHKKLGCPEVLMTGGVRVKTGPGRFEVEMGGTDFWTETMGKVSLQGSPLDVPITKEASKKLSWSYTGEVTVGPDGLLRIDLAPGAKGEPVVLAYVIVRGKQ